MRLLVDFPRVQLPGLIVASLVLAGCPSDAPGDGEAEANDDDTDEQQACFEPGSPLLDSTRPVGPSGAAGPSGECGTGWATDAPQLDATWSIELGVGIEFFSFTVPQMKAHPDGGVVVATAGLFARYDESGDELWSDPSALPPEVRVAMAVEATGTIVLSYMDWNAESAVVRRYAADGSSLGPVAIPWNSPEYTEVWALEAHGDELFVGGVDVDAQGSFETTLLRLDAAGELLLRKSTNMTSSGQLAVNDTGTAVFGSFPSFLLATSNGAVQGTLAPSSGGIAQVVGFGSDFVMAGTAAAGDLSIGRYSEFGVERWLQSYDRAANGDNGRAVAVGPDGSIVAVGTTQLVGSFNVYWFGSEPVILGVDEDGNATWSDRIDAVGEANGVAIGSAGEVYVLGAAEGISEQTGDTPPLITWLRRYDP